MRFYFNSTQVHYKFINLSLISNANKLEIKILRLMYIYFTNPIYIALSKTCAIEYYCY